jgi:DNA-binding beta-propeller fold protein YncE/mono/diheme cytochrome c family protein
MQAIRPACKPSFSLKIVLALAAMAGYSGAWAQDEIAELTARGNDLFMERVSCWICHGENAEGLVGPSLQHGPTPMDIQVQLDSNPQMAVIVSELNPDAEDLLAIATYIRDMNDIAVSATDIADWRGQLAEMAAARGPEAEFFLTERDKLVMQIQSFDTVLADWPQRAKTGSLKRGYDVQVFETFDAGEQVFFPEPGKLYFYQNTATTVRMIDHDATPTNTSQVVVGDASTKEVIAYSQMPQELRGGVHTTVLSPDASHVYIIGGGLGMGMGGLPPTSRTASSVVKVDALTLKPVKHMNIGGRLHHGQIFQDRYLLIDMFASDPDALDVFLFDPETDEVVGGIRGEDLGGQNYTSYTDDEFIYVLMQPAGANARGFAAGSVTAMRPYWVTKLDPVTWEVVAEYPYTGYRGDWIIIDSSSEYMYVPAAVSNNVTKVNLITGAIEWATSTGIGPYGGTLNADETEIWISNKGETSGQFGRTITVIETATGRLLDTVFSGYKADHVLLSPDGTEMWATSNGEGSIYVFDAKTREQLDVIPMPHRGEPHGLVWVAYDENGEGAVVRDQGGFHNGVHPARGNPLTVTANAR